MRYGHFALGVVLVVGLACALPGAADAGDGPEGMAWVDDLPAAFAAAKAQGKPLMICINAKRVGGFRPEPAAKELRTHTYKDKKVIDLSASFVCAFLTAAGSSEDYGELRLRYGIDGDIVSPQHVFAYPDGSLIFRREYWPYGTGQKAVDALLRMMQRALDTNNARSGATPPATETEDEPEPESMPDDEAEDVEIPDADDVAKPPEDEEERAAWIEAQVRLVSSPDEIVRRGALRALLEADREGDTLAVVIGLLEKMKKHPFVLIDIVRELGRPGLEKAAKPVAEYLDHKERDLRANAAVSLEYIGSKDSVSVLTKRAGREKDSGVANHMYRALGRCGVGSSKVRSTLVKNITGAKTNFASYGPIIGLAYFESDPKAAREVEKLIKKVGMPSGGRGGWRGTTKRSLLGWCLSEVGFGNPKSAKFVREEVMPAVGQSRWSEMVLDFYRLVAEACDGNKEAKEGLDEAVRGALGRSSGGSLMEAARRGRGHTGFTPKGEFGMGSGGD